MTAQSTTWIVAPYSPSVAAFWPVVRDVYPDAATINCNDSIEIFRPDYFLMFDANSCRKYQGTARQVQAAGTKLVTLAKTPASLKLRGTDHYDIFLPLAKRGNALSIHFTRGQYADCGFSRLFCLQFAVNNGATHILLLGMEGYPPTTPQWIANQESVTAFVCSCVEQCSDVQFTFCGKPNYKLPPTNNHRVFDTPEQFKEAYQLCESV